MKLKVPWKQKITSGFPAAGETWQEIVWPTPGVQERIFDTFWFSAYGALNSAMEEEEEQEQEQEDEQQQQQ